MRPGTTAPVVGTLAVVVLEMALLTGVWPLGAGALAIHALLLAAVAVGWYAWFRRLVAERRTLEQRLSSEQGVDERERRMLALVQNSADLIVVIEADGSTSFVSPSARKVVGRDPEHFVGRPLEHLLGEESLVVDRLMRVRRQGDQPVRVRLVHADSRSLVAEGTLTNLLDEPSVGAWVLTLRDVTDRHVAAEELKHQAFHDSLTGLANRALFTDRLAHALMRRRDPGSAAVLFWDIDDFKAVNDTHGHSVGDRLLVVVADRLRGAFRPTDTVARLGGDEFAVLLEDVDDEAAQMVTHRVLESLSAPVEVDGRAWTVSASVGIATAVAGESTGEELLRNADIAMYWAKENGKGSISMYDPLRHAASLDVLALQNDLIRAMETGELVLFFQPTVDLGSRAVTGFEALVRWQHPERGTLSPAEFVPAAERSGLVVPLGSWVLREACRAAMTLSADGEGPTMSVNVAAQHLVRPGFVAEVAEVLAETGLPAGRLVVEVTESVLLDDFEAAESALNGLRDLGCWIAIDDFGTGYSSLSYLSQLPVDMLKVDKSFTDRVCSEDHAASVTLAILEMSRSLRLLTIAEGIETAEQATWLEEHGCVRGQGYLWSPAVPLADARTLLLDSDDLPDADTESVDA